MASHCIHPYPTLQISKSFVYFYMLSNPDSIDTKYSSQEIFFRVQSIRLYHQIILSLFIFYM